MIQALLATKANPEDLDVVGYTPLMIAAVTGLPMSLRTLLAYKANHDAKEKGTARTALQLAVTNGQLKSVERMMEPLQPPPPLVAGSERTPRKLKKTRRKKTKLRQRNQEKRPLGARRRPLMPTPSRRL